MARVSIDRVERSIGSVEAVCGLDAHGKLVVLSERDRCNHRLSLR
jgi:hypothetical protein